MQSCFSRRQNKSQREVGQIVAIAFYSCAYVLYRALGAINN